MKNREKFSIENKNDLILEGAASTIDISGTFYFNSYKEYNSQNTIKQAWINVGKYLEKSMSGIESEKNELIAFE